MTMNQQRWRHGGIAPAVGARVYVANLLISLDRLLLTSWRTGEWHPVLSQLLANTRVLCELHEEPISLASYPLMQRAVNDLLQRFSFAWAVVPDHHPLLLDMEDVSEVGYGQVSGAALRQWLGNAEESDERLVYAVRFWQGCGWLIIADKSTLSRFWLSGFFFSSVGKTASGPVDDGRKTSGDYSKTRRIARQLRRVIAYYCNYFSVQNYRRLTVGIGAVENIPQ